MSDGQRYFLGRDNSSHRYLVPIQHYDAWHDWAEIPEDDERSWEVPDFARRIYNPYRLTFTDPHEA